MRFSSLKSQFYTWILREVEVK